MALNGVPDIFFLNVSKSCALSIKKKLGLPNAAKNYCQHRQKLVFGSQNRPKEEDYILMALPFYFVILFYLSVLLFELIFLFGGSLRRYWLCYASCDGQSMHHAPGSGSGHNN